MTSSQEVVDVSEPKTTERRNRS